MVKGSFWWLQKIVRGVNESAVFSDHANCSCQCYKYNNLCKHTMCVAEIAGILKERWQHLKESPRQLVPCKSGLAEPPKETQGKRVVTTRTPTDLPDKSHRKLLRLVLLQRFTTTSRISSSVFLIHLMWRNAGNVAASFLRAGHCTTWYCSVSGGKVTAPRSQQLQAASFHQYAKPPNSTTLKDPA